MYNVFNIQSDSDSFFFFRLSISENGCLNVLHHDNSQQILSKIVQSLGVDEAGNCLY